jgi:hypothetical protein
MKKVYLVFILIFLFQKIYCQKGLHLGFSIGPDKTLNSWNHNEVLPPHSKFKGRTSVAEVLFIEYGFTNLFSLRTSIKHVPLGYHTAFDHLIQSYGTSGSVIPGGGTYMNGFSYIFFELSLRGRYPLLINKKLYVTTVMGISYMNTGKYWVSEDQGGITCHGIDNLEYRSFTYIIDNQRNLGINASLGLDLLVFKNKYLFIDLHFNKGFKKISYSQDYTNLNGDKYYNERICKGSYATVQAGIKLPVNIKLHFNKIIPKKKNDYSDQKYD